ncbi:MAG: hypothetical protein CMD90_00215 [Gammaproteobacteria bacterium]|nr:hypothetical protein [Gammaproteobacteria bacterium]|tara:strand:+ start:258 stop:689 length:432 start_codon:yes stop_codon:yes gene_type:complete
MFKKIKSVFSNNKKKNKDTELEDINIACAILLIEVSYADFDINTNEEQVILDSLKSNFNISDNKALWLISISKDRHKNTNCLRPYIKEINEKFSREEKRNLIKEAWKVARADNFIDKYEEHRIRKISQLLHLTHKDFIDAKIS